MTAATGLAPRTSGYAYVDGVHMYYEIYGEGSHLVLLHGGMLTIGLNFALAFRIGALQCHATLTIPHGENLFAFLSGYIRGG